MVWYVPPLSPIQNAATRGEIGMNGMIPDVKSLRIPLSYLANLLTAGKEEPVQIALERMLAMRVFMRSKHVDQIINSEILERVSLTEETVEEMYRYMAIAHYDDRFVIPTSHKEYAEHAFDIRSSCGFSFGSGCTMSDKPKRKNLFGGKTDAS